MTTINVTSQHLTRGIPGDCNTCPVALAIEDAFPNAASVTVGGQYLSFQDGGRVVVLNIPETGRIAIGAIDRGELLEPFTFELDYPKAAA